MRLLILLLAVATPLGDRTLGMSGRSVAFHPLDNKKTFEEAQKRYRNNIRFGMFEDALPFVEPELQPRFQEAIRELRELRFREYRVESIEIENRSGHRPTRRCSMGLLALVDLRVGAAHPPALAPRGPAPRLVLDPGPRPAGQPRGRLSRADVQRVR